LRRIIRRAVRHGNKLGATGSFFYKMVQPLIDVMGDAYPELINRRDVIEATLLKEEEQFARTLEQGLKLLEGELANLQGNTIAGATVFKLYDTYGFPVDLTADIARERDLVIDQAGFESEMAAQRQRARDAGKFNIDYNSIVNVDQDSVFQGYEGTQGQGNIIALYKDGQAVDQLSEGDEGLIVLDQTPFYAESGGQVGDTGLLTGDSGIFEVQDTKKSGGAIVHQGLVTMGQVSLKQAVQATAKADLRAATARNHSATHLLHAALRQVLGEHVSQKGSLVSSQVLRFDFANDQPVSFEQLQQIEQIVNREVLANNSVITEVLDIDSAKQKGAMMLFGEKYGDVVRVLSMGSQVEERSFSIELCGGIHVQRTGDIGLFKITSEGGIAAGIRRIEAVTGTTALAVIQQADSQLQQISGLIKTSKDLVLERVQANFERSKELEKQIERLNQKLANAQSAELVEQVQDIAGVKTLIATLEQLDAKTLRNLHDSVKSRLDNAVIVLAATEDDKVSLLASVSKELTSKVKAGDIIKHLTEQLGGKGGGKPDLAQGGAALSPAYKDVIAQLPAWLNAKYSA
jgi:alanyl-tRNA synthetase